MSRVSNSSLMERSKICGERNGRWKSANYGKMQWLNRKYFSSFSSFTHLCNHRSLLVEFVLCSISSKAVQLFLFMWIVFYLWVWWTAHQDVTEGMVWKVPWKQQGSCHDGLSQFLWHQTRAPSGQDSHTCSLHSASLSAARRADRPGENTDMLWVFWVSKIWKKNPCKGQVATDSHGNNDNN